MALKGRLGELNERQERALSVCDQNANRLLRLINDLLLTARLHAGKMTLDPKPLGLRSVLTEAIDYLQADAEVAGVTIDLEAPSGEVFIRGNKDRLVEAFMHLIERGLRGKRTGERLRIEVATRGRVGAVELLLEGVGVSETELPQLFEPFRVEGGSPNIGLSIARQVFDLHGGHISAEREDGDLVFHVALPLFAGVVTALQERPAPRRGEILIVEDDDDCRNGLIEYLEAEHHRVRAYGDGREALERIQKVPPALVLLDLRIPGVDGAALVKTLRESETGTPTPIYVISGAIDAGAGTEQAWGERVDGVFEKPINFPYLLERVREFVAPEEAP
jgi:CheY-like chemotaxis protein